MYILEYAGTPDEIYMKGHGSFQFPWIAQRYSSRKHAYIILTPLNPTFI